MYCYVKLQSHKSNLVILILFLTYIIVCNFKENYFIYLLLSYFSFKMKKNTAKLVLKELS